MCFHDHVSNFGFTCSSKMLLYANFHLAEDKERYSMLMEEQMVGKGRMSEVTERFLEGTEELWRKKRGKNRKKQKCPHFAAMLATMSNVVQNGTTHHNLMFPLKGTRGRCLTYLSRVKYTSIAWDTVKTLSY